MPNGTTIRAASWISRALATFGILLVVASIALSWAWTPGLATTYAQLGTDRIALVGGTAFDLLEPFLAGTVCIVALSFIGWALLGAAISLASDKAPNASKSALQRFAGIAGLAIIIVTIAFAAAGSGWAWAAALDLASLPFVHTFSPAWLLPATAGVCLGLSLGRAN